MVLIELTHKGKQLTDYNNKQWNFYNALPPKAKRHEVKQHQLK